MGEKYQKIYFSFIPFPLLKIPTLGTENSCFFHSILRAYSYLYSSLSTSAEKTKYSRLVRNLLSDRLSETSENGKIVYENLYRGELQNFAMNVKAANIGDIPDYTLAGLQKTLRSNDMVDHSFQELISDALDIDIYILDEVKKDYYFVGDDKCISESDLNFDKKDNVLHKNRKSIIIGYNENFSHYSTLGMMTLDGEVTTLFDTDHILIETIKKRICSTLKN